MEGYQTLLLDVWREACRHIAITQSTETIARLIADHLPVDQVLVRRIDLQRCCVETVAVGVPEGPVPEARKECAPMELELLLAWCRQGKVSHSQGKSSGSEMAAILPGAGDGDVLAGPLQLPEERFGALVMIARRDAAFEGAHVDLVRVLLEPFSVALENDQRLNEIASLREAAEADRRSLLTRLGRNRLTDTVVGVDSGLRAVMERVELVARSDVPVLIFGETGSGKEVVARQIHNRSPRASGPFIRVNCGAIPHELIDSELFGHEKGAFTGAVEARKGWFERADGGTLLLDELGELPPAAQVRLLRILQDGWLDRVGGHKPVHVDVRIVAATHRDLPAMVTEGKFREDLWYRVAVFPIVLPPLRDRREDIPGLVRHFAQKAATRFGLYPVLPTAEDLELLMSYPWPGNVRELGTVIDRAAILGDGKRLEVAKALGITTAPGGPPSGNDPPPRPAAPAPRHIESLDAAMRRHIEAALTAVAGRIEGAHGAARLLEINPHTLRARMRKLGIDWKQFRQGGRDALQQAPIPQ
jgi:transcriptional regulator with GAF, ATPase, and Fis domain